MYNCLQQLYGLPRPSTGADPSFVGPEAYTIFEALFQKKILQNHKYKIGFESE
jgi:hypothetical protein